MPSIKTIAIGVACGLAAVWLAHNVQAVGKIVGTK